ncbi:hypothetical protein Tco_0227002 [Tanacetum coccineum]
MLLAKTKADDYGHVKWIEDKVPRSIWSLAQVVYDKHAYWGTYHWGPKRQRFYGYATNMEISKDVYSKHRTIAVTSLKIMEFFGYKHLEEITVRRQDDQLYRFREGDFKRLRRQDIKDMLLLLRHLSEIIQHEMEILLEPTSNKLMVGDLCDSIRIKLVTTGKKRWCDSIRIKLVPEHAEFDESDTHVLERLDTSAGNPVKEFLLKLNLPNHRILKDRDEGT